VAGFVFKEARRFANMADRYSLTKEEIDKVKEEAGIYTIYCSVAFQRLRGQTDILYIGKAEGKTLRRRIMSVITGKGREAWPRFQRLQDAGFNLSFSYEPCLNPKEREREELIEYENKHLELPPLNHSGGKL
jgi:hypothetical protein